MFVCRNASSGNINGTVSIWIMHLKSNIKLLEDVGLMVSSLLCLLQSRTRSLRKHAVGFSLVKWCKLVSSAMFSLLPISLTTLVSLCKRTEEMHLCSSLRVRVPRPLEQNIMQKWQNSAFSLDCPVVVYMHQTACSLLLMVNEAMHCWHKWQTQVSWHHFQIKQHH